MTSALRALANSVKARAEEATGCRLYRKSIPQGTDLAADLDRSFGRENIRIVFDVGANVGQSALAYLELFSRATIYSFEPVRATFAELAAATQAHTRIRSFHCAMGTQEEKRAIHVASDSRKSSIDHVRDGDRTEEIDIKTLDSFAATHGIQTIDFLKVDTEGHELAVLQGASSLLRAQKVRLLMLECEPVATGAGFTSMATVAEFLQPFCYSLFGIYDQQLDWHGTRRIQYFNALFVSGETAEHGFTNF